MSKQVEGFVARLLDRDDPTAKLLRGSCDFYVVPNANIDGSVRGHLRSNAAGVDLSREWARPSRSRSPVGSVAIVAHHHLILN